METLLREVVGRKATRLEMVPFFAEDYLSLVWSMGLLP
jgi:hypothetical protein